MADSTVVDISKMKVVDLRKELKSRGLPHTGDKAELITRLQAAITQETHDDTADINLDSDEIDSDGVLDEDETLSGAVDEELALAENPPPVKAPSPLKEETKSSKPLKRKSTTSESDKARTSENKEAGGKKIVLNRVPITAPAAENVVSEKTVTDVTDTTSKTNTAEEEKSKVKITSKLDTQSRLELRAKRFGLPIKVSDEERKVARMQRFSQDKNSAASITSDKTASLSENLDKLKKRAERFGQNVSKVMSDIEMKERLEKRKAKFGVVAK